METEHVAPELVFADPHEMLAWLESLPAEHTFKKMDTSRCLGAQYARHRGFPEAVCGVAEWWPDPEDEERYYETGEWFYRVYDRMGYDPTAPEVATLLRTLLAGYGA